MILKYLCRILSTSAGFHILKLQAGRHEYILLAVDSNPERLVPLSEIMNAQFLKCHPFHSFPRTVHESDTCKTQAMAERALFHWPFSG